MRIRGLFCATAAANNEEYKKVLRRRNLWLSALALTGILITVVTLSAFDSGSAALPEYMQGVYCGFGSGLTIAGLMLIVRNLLLMRDEEKLKQSRLEDSDERLGEIGNRACRTAVKMLLLVMVAGGMIGGIYEQVLVKALLVALDVFLLSYVAAFAYFKRVM